jgi:hypothetical protein
VSRWIFTSVCCRPHSLFRSRLWRRLSNRRFGWAIIIYWVPWCGVPWGRGLLNLASGIGRVCLRRGVFRYAIGICWHSGSWRRHMVRSRRITFRAIVVSGIGRSGLNHSRWRWWCRGLLRRRQFGSTRFPTLLTSPAFSQCARIVVF